MNAIILCGGLSTRLGDITKNIPKILLDIGGKTVFDWQIEKLKKAGIKNVVLAAGHLSDVLFKFVGNERNGISITYAIEEERLGTGGAIKFAYSFIKDKNKPAVILNGDVLTSVAIGEMTDFLKPKSSGIILGTYVEDASTYGTLESNDENLITAFKEKVGKQEPGYINSGMYIFNKSAFAFFPDKKVFSIEYDVFPKMRDLYVYKSKKPWIDVGLPDRLEWARQNFKIFA